MGPLLSVGVLERVVVLGLALVVLGLAVVVLPPLVVALLLVVVGGFSVVFLVVVGPTVGVVVMTPVVVVGKTVVVGPGRRAYFESLMVSPTRPQPPTANNDSQLFTRPPCV